MTPASGPLPISHLAVQISQPFVLPVEALPRCGRHRLVKSVPAVLFSIWVCGFSVSAAVWLRFWRSFRTTIRAGTPLHLDLPIQMYYGTAHIWSARHSLSDTRKEVVSSQRRQWPRSRYELLCPAVRQAGPRRKSHRPAKLPESRCRSEVERPVPPPEWVASFSL